MAIASFLDRTKPEKMACTWFGEICSCCCLACRNKFHQTTYRPFFRALYVFGPSGFWTMAPLRCTAKFDPFLSLDCAPTPSTLAQSKERKGSNIAIWQPCLHPRFLLPRAGRWEISTHRHARKQPCKHFEGQACEWISPPSSQESPDQKRLARHRVP